MFFYLFDGALHLQMCDMTSNCGNLGRRYDVEETRPDGAPPRPDESTGRSATGAQSRDALRGRAGRASTSRPSVDSQGSVRRLKVPRLVSFPVFSLCSYLSSAEERVGLDGTSRHSASSELNLKIVNTALKIKLNCITIFIHQL